MDVALLVLAMLVLFVVGVGPLAHEAIARRERSRAPAHREALCRMPGCPLALGHIGSHVSAWPGL
jgi:hypothetical protein